MASENFLLKEKKGQTMIKYTENKVSNIINCQRVK